MSKQLVLSSQLLVFASHFCWAGPSEISKRLDRITKVLTEGYRAKSPIGPKETLAAFTLSASEKLEKGRVGFAIAEILSSLFVRDQTFTVLERSEISQILSEQKLQFTGAIDPATAVQMGKLLGARILLLGSVESFGEKYQINARLVSAETGEILVAAFEEVDAKLFEKEAKPYLMLVPERDVLGVYVAKGFGRDAISSYEAVYFVGNLNDVRGIVPGAPTVSSNQTGFGLRYFPFSKGMVDMAYFPKQSNFTGIIALKPNNHPVHSDLFFRSSLLKTSVNMAVGISKMFRTYVGLGANVHFLKGWVDGASDMTAAGGGFTIRQEKIDFKKTLLIPFARVGIEWKPRPKLGLGIFENAGLTKSEYVINSHVSATGVVSSRDAPMYKFAPSRFSTEISASFYF